MNNFAIFLFIATCFASAVTAMPHVKRGLDPDNRAHRSWSDSLDRNLGGNKAYDNFVRPSIHGTYHAGRYVTGGGNPEEWARAKDQFSKIGTGQQQTEYLQAHRQNHK